MKLHKLNLFKPLDPISGLEKTEEQIKHKYSQTNIECGTLLYNWAVQPKIQIQKNTKRDWWG